MTRMHGTDGQSPPEMTAGAEAAFASYIARVQRGEKVDFEIGQSAKGPQAQKVRLT